MCTSERLSQKQTSVLRQASGSCRSPDMMCCDFVQIISKTRDKRSKYSNMTYILCSMGSQKSIMSIFRCVVGGGSYKCKHRAVNSRCVITTLYWDSVQSSYQRCIRELIQESYQRCIRELIEESNWGCIRERV